MSEELAKVNKPVLGNKFGLTKRVAERTEMAQMDCSNFPNRLGIVMDDSGSMGGSMEQVHLAIDTFIKNCNSVDTAIALYPLNKEAKNLTNNYAAVGLYAHSIDATGGTPLYTKLKELITKESITRAVAFSDGSPTDYDEECTTQYIGKKIPIDTIFIGSLNGSGYKVMQMIAEKTGGVFLHFTDASVLAKSLKYLTPAFRYMLENAELKKQVEKGTL